MELNKFIENMAEQFDDADTSAFSADTVFKDVEGWSSMTSLAVIAMVDDEYDVQIQGSDIRECKTIRDLFERVKNMKE